MCKSHGKSFNTHATLVKVEHSYCYHTYVAVGLPWYSIQIYLFIFPSYSFWWGFSMDHYFLSHSEPLFSSSFRLFPCQDWDLLVHWDDFNDDLVNFSRLDAVHTVAEGPYQLETSIYGEIRYMPLWFDFALWCMSNTYACHVRMIMVTYAYIVLMLELVRWLIKELAVKTIVHAKFGQTVNLSARLSHMLLVPIHLFHQFMIFIPWLILFETY